MRHRIRRNQSILAVAVVIGALVLAGCGSGSKSSVVTSASPPPPTATSVAPSASAPTSGSTAPGASGQQAVTITPSSGLKSGQTVHVVATGFSPNEALVVNECADKGQNTGPGDCNLEGLVQAMSDASGKVETDYTVTTGPFGANKIVCSATQACLLSVSQATPSPTEEADVQLRFS